MFDLYGWTVGLTLHVFILKHYNVLFLRYWQYYFLCRIERNIYTFVKTTQTDFKVIWLKQWKKEVVLLSPQLRGQLSLFQRLTLGLGLKCRSHRCHGLKMDWSCVCVRKPWGGKVSVLRRWGCRWLWESIHTPALRSWPGNPPIIGMISFRILDSDMHLNIFCLFKCKFIIWH